MIAIHERFVRERRVIIREHPSGRVIVRPPHEPPSTFRSLFCAVDFAKQRWPGLVLDIHTQEGDG